MAVHQGERVVDLRERAKAAGIVGYSKLKKAELLNALANPAMHRERKTPGRKNAGPTVAQLRKDAKAAGLKGYSNKNKAELLAMLGRAGVGGATARMGAYSPYYGRR